MTIRENCFSGYDGLPLFERSWLPAGRPRAAVVLIHGLVEHSGCHAATALELAERGFAVHAMDLRGHGRSERPRCEIRSFDQYLRDLDVFFARAARLAGDAPLFLMGNSMGGLIATLWTILRRPPIRGLALSGPLFAWADSLYPRQRYLARVVAALAPTWRAIPIPFERLASQPQMVDRYRDDPLVFHGRLTVHLAAELIRAMKTAHRQAAALSVPLLILHGNQDQICGPAGSLALYRKAGCADKTIHLYEGFYHEVFDEPERERVMADLTGWLVRRLPAADAAAVQRSTV